MNWNDQLLSGTHFSIKCMYDMISTLEKEHVEDKINLRHSSGAGGDSHCVAYYIFLVRSLA